MPKVDPNSIDLKLQEISNGIKDLSKVSIDGLKEAVDEITSNLERLSHFLAVNAIRFPLEDDPKKNIDNGLYKEFSKIQDKFGGVDVAKPLLDVLSTSIGANVSAYMIEEPKVESVRHSPSVSSVTPPPEKESVAAPSLAFGAHLKEPSVSGPGIELTTFRSRTPSE